MKSRLLQYVIGLLFLGFFFESCKISENAIKNENNFIPKTYKRYLQDSSNVAHLNWRTYFADSSLTALIDTALKNNQELNIISQEIEIRKNEVRARKGEYLPFVNIAAGFGIEKPGKYTRFGAIEEQLEVKPGVSFPQPLPDGYLSAAASWEIDVWKKLRNAKKSAVMMYLASREGKKFMETRLIAEIAEAYYELMALDNLLEVIDKNVKIQFDALQIVKQQKEAAKLTQLAINRFEAQLLNTENLEFAIKQKIIETENRINFLTGRFPQPIKRNTFRFLDINIDSIQIGIPSQLLLNRPDIQEAEFELAAAKLDVSVARANFYPSLRITAGIGFRAFNPVYLVHPESFLYNLAGDLIAPLINRNAIQAAYNAATARQIQAVYRYERTILNAYVDVLNQLYKIENLSKSFETKKKQVDILIKSIGIANSLFNSARADYTEVLLTQREALEAKTELIEIKLRQLSAKVNIYRALGGGWK
jgi:NodT family efflux transporter outer membrane factor (OMF) lipoprotein